MYVDMCTDMRTDMCIDMCIAVCIGVCIDMCIGMCIDISTIAYSGLCHTPFADPIGLDRPAHECPRAMPAPVGDADVDTMPACSASPQAWLALMMTRRR